MTPRERVLTALSHRLPDRTPCDFLGGRAHLEAAARPPGSRRPRPGARTVGRGCASSGSAEPAGTSPGRRACIRTSGASAMSTAKRPGDRCARTAGGPGRRRRPWPTWSFSPGPRQTSSITPPLTEQCQRWESYALIYGFADVWQRPALVRGWEGMFVDMVERPEWAHFLCRKFTDFYKEDYTRAAEATDGRIDLYLVISDLGSQSGPLISLSMFRQFVGPYLKEMIGLHPRSGGESDVP